MTSHDRRERLEKRFYERLTFFRAVNIIVSVALALTLGAALLERLIEPQTFDSFGAACWWAIATVSTTGYGDLVPQTVAGKVVASFVMVAALAWVPAVTAIVTTLHVRRHEERRRGAHTSNAAQQVGLEEIVERLDRLERRLSSQLAPSMAVRPDRGTPGGNHAIGVPASDALRRVSAHRDRCDT